MQINRLLKIDESDNVLVALVDLEPGEITHEDLRLTLQQPVAQKHKFLTTDLLKGDKVVMYGVPVGMANWDLKAGTVITIENVTHFADEVVIRDQTRYDWQVPDIAKWHGRTFNGYHRPDGSVGTANYWLFVPLVFCENRNLKVIEEALSKGLGYHKPNRYEEYVRTKVSSQTAFQAASSQQQVFENIDGIKFLYHHGGCGGTRQDSETLLRLLAGYVSHPNVAGATVLSLGCQHAQIDWFQQIQKELYPQIQKPVIFLEQQKLLSEEKLITEAIDQTVEQLSVVNRIERQPAGLDKLVVGLECGGSDGFSGISANPAVGHASDLIVALGGATILSEFPELNGVEQNIVDRCVSREVAEKFLRIQRAYEARAKAVGSGFDMNPSPGNIKDGLITDAIKSAGAAKKGGKAPVRAILDYTEPVTEPGLNLLCTPGNDVESTTGLAGSGANVILFTTGLGTPTGNPITPVIKISSNTALYNRMNDLIDLDAGGITRGEASIEQIGEEFLEKIIAVASGQKTKAMELEQNDFIPWKRGVSL
ncbi:altronate dehydratase family protein [Pontibacter sp. E15-1]|uniref:UxaA family hydrolase n=1 Tax=Pontibacter sp. E15-1 TaxID=2919918 RepID=UPI001F501148|nr:altronate dehydratase family protein [Pontibacter sp. E15-1]MCJ8165723.1 altronate dehydratase family protein [Pontibacter sp. E15-1]